MGIYQILAMLILAVLLLRLGIKVIKLLKTPDWDRKKIYQRETEVKRSLLVFCAVGAVLAICAVVLFAANWSWIKTVETSRKKVRKEAELIPVMDDNIYALKDEHYFYFLKENGAVIKRVSGRYINYDTDETPYVETYRAKRIYYLVTDKKELFPIYIEGPDTGCIIHLNNIDQVKQLNIPYLSSWD